MDVDHSYASCYQCPTNTHPIVGRCAENDPSMCQPGQEWDSRCGCHDLCDSCQEYNFETCACEQIPNRGRGIGTVTDNVECACDNYFLLTNGSGGCVPKDLTCGGDSTYCYKNTGGMQCCNQSECGQNGTVCYNP